MSSLSRKLKELFTFLNKLECPVIFWKNMGGGEEKKKELITVFPFQVLTLGDIVEYFLG